MNAERGVYWRRRVLAVAGLLAMVGAVVLAASALQKVFGDGSSAPTPPTSARTESVTIPEGYDRSQIAELAKKEGLTGDYEKASESFKAFEPAKYGAENPSSLEGFLFPATYELPHRPSVEDLISRQLDAFAENMNRVDMSYAESKNLTPYDVLTIASMIEREVQVPDERKLVAAVIYNRLSQGMQLQIDATIRYAEGNYTEPLTESDLQIDSPYNTYTNLGLPPTPIGNPGLASIEAAAHPASVDYLYYVVKPCGNGEHYFTSSYEAFQQAQQRYESARLANGGRSPESC